MRTKFQPPRFGQYLQAVRSLDRYSRRRHGKHVMALAMRWVLDQPGVAVTLWGPRRPQDLDPLTNVLGWKLDREALTQIDELLARSVTAPPEHRQEA